MTKQGSLFNKSDREKFNEEPLSVDVTVSLTVAHEDEGALQDSPKQNGVPVDRGWAWVVLFAAWCNCLLSNGVYRTFGIMFIEIQAKYGSTSSVTSLIVSVMNGSYSISALLVTTIGLQYFSSRQFIVLGGIIMTLAYALSAFAPNVEILILLLGCVCGISQGMILTPTMALIGEYFEKYRSIANCISNMGASVGSLAFSVLIPIWIEEYAFPGTVLLLGGFMLQMTVSGLLMRPISFYSKQRRQHVNHKDSEDKMKNGEKNLNEMNKQKVNGSLRQTNSLKKTVTKIGYNSNHQNGLVQKAASPLIANTNSPFSPRKTVKRKRTISEISRISLSHRVGSAISALNNSNIGLYASTELAFSSMLDLSSMKREQNQNSQTVNKTSYACFRKFCPNLGSVIDCRAMKRISFLFFIPCACFIVTVSSISIYLPAFAKDTGLSSKECGLLITIISITDMCTIVFWGIFADRNYIQRHKILSFAVVTVGIASCFTPLFETRTEFFIYSVIFGIFGRVYFSLFPVVLVDFIGIENLRSALGILSLAQTGTSAIMQPIIGMMRDNFKTYIPGMLLISTLVIVGGLLILTLPMAARCEKRNDTKEIQVDLKA